jgi:hypothetical protein
VRCRSRLGTRVSDRVAWRRLLSCFRAPKVFFRSPPAVRRGQTDTLECCVCRSDGTLVGGVIRLPDHPGSGCLVRIEVVAGRQSSVPRIKGPGDLRASDSEDVSESAALTSRVGYGWAD